jgi:hypothetical protein
MRVHRNPTVKVDANENSITTGIDQNPITAGVDQNSINAGANQNSMTADVDQHSTTAEDNQNLITSVAETTGRVAAKVSNVIDSLTGAFKSRRKR